MNMNKEMLKQAAASLLMTKMMFKFVECRRLDKTIEIEHFCESWFDKYTDGTITEDTKDLTVSLFIQALRKDVSN